MRTGSGRRATPPDGGLTITVPFTALRRFLIRFLVLTIVIGVPAMLVAYLVSGRQSPVYFAEATLLIPTTTSSALEIGALGEQLTIEGAPVMPAAYVPALSGQEVLEDAWRRLTPADAPAPTRQDLRVLADSIDVRFEPLRRSTLLMVGAEGATRVEALARANALADALLAWDDTRARAEAAQVANVLEAQLTGLEEQLEALRRAGSRANQPQMAGIAVLTATLREDIALARAGAVGARGSLELLRPAPSSTQLEPSPVLDAIVVFVLTGIAVMAGLLVMGALNRRLHGAQAIADFSGLPVIADLGRAATARSAPARAGAERATPRHGYREVPFIKAHVDNALPSGGDVLVVGLREGDHAGQVASTLAKLYPQGLGAATTISTASPLLAGGAAVERAAHADAVILVIGTRETNRSDLSRALTWLDRARAHVIGVVTTA